MMNKEAIERVLGALRAEASNKRESAGQAGLMHDNGASEMFYSISMYEKGFNQVVPDEWKSLYQTALNQIELEKDADFKEYKRLKLKFEGVPVK